MKPNHPAAIRYDPPLAVKVLWNGVWLPAQMIGEMTSASTCAVRIPKLGRGGVQYVPSATVRR